MKNIIEKATLLGHFTLDVSTIEFQNVEANSIAKLIPAAVLVPIIDEPGELLVLLTQRTLELKNHAGQISFPGGRKEQIDHSLKETALRETYEETGIKPEQINMIGNLPPVESRTGFLVMPFIGLITPPLELKIDPLEVAAVFTAPLDFLLDPNNQKQEIFIHQGKQMPLYSIQFQEHKIWGLTAKILVEMGKILLKK
jgi:8-oxo-dGTP pyrophosphatase MutT (NUDIX family)